MYNISSEWLQNSLPPYQDITRHGAKISAERGSERASVDNKCTHGPYRWPWNAGVEMEISVEVEKCSEINKYMINICMKNTHLTHR